MDTYGAADQSQKPRSAGSHVLTDSGHFLVRIGVQWISALAVLALDRATSALGAATRRTAQGVILIYEVRTQWVDYQWMVAA